MIAVTWTLAGVILFAAAAFGILRALEQPGRHRRTPGAAAPAPDPIPLPVAGSLAVLADPDETASMPVIAAARFLP